MSFHASSLRVAGQDSDFIDIIFPSSLSPVPGKEMYGNSDSIKSWIRAIDRANKCTPDLGDPKNDDVFRFATHPFRNRLPHSPFSDEFESESDSDVSFCFAAAAWAPELFSSSSDDDSDGESSLSDDAQYIAIPSDSPWYRRPSPSPGPVSARELDTAVYAPSCSSDVRQAIAQQELLLAVFHDELRRIVPRADGAAYDSNWLENVDADLVLAPQDTYVDLCWESAVCEKAPSAWLGRPMPDVPIGFDDIYAAY